MAKKRVGNVSATGAVSGMGIGMRGSPFEGTPWPAPWEVAGGGRSPSMRGVQGVSMDERAARKGGWECECGRCNFPERRACVGCGAPPPPGLRGPSPSPFRAAGLGHGWGRDGRPPRGQGPSAWDAGPPSSAAAAGPPPLAAAGACTSCVSDVLCGIQAIDPALVAPDVRKAASCCPSDT